MFRIALPPAALIAALVLFLAPAHSQDPRSAQDAFARELIAALAEPPSPEEAALRVALRPAPHRAAVFVQDLLRQSLEEPPESWAFASARRVARALELETGSKTAALAAERYAAFDEEARAARLECDRVWVSAQEALADGRLEQALEGARTVVEVARSLEDAYVEARGLRTLGQVHLARGEHEAALEELERCRSLDAAGGFSLDEATDLKLAGDASSALGRPAAALDLYERAARLAQERAFPSPVPDGQLGSWYAWFGRYDEARELLTRALAAAAGDAPLEVELLSSLGTLESARGRYAEARRLLDAALAKSRAAEDTLGEGSTLVLIGGIESELGRPADAERTLRAALEHLDEERAPVRAAYAWMQIGLARIDAGRPGDALEVLARAERAFVACGFELGRAETLHHRARALLDLGRLEEAEAAWTETARMRRASASPLPLALALTGLGDTQERRGDLKQAARSYAQALATAAAIDTPEARWRASFGAGRVLEAQGESERALATYLATLEDVEVIRAHLEGPALRLAYLEDKLGLYRRTARLLARAGELEQAFHWSEAAKARTLLERFGVGPDERLGAQAGDAAGGAAGAALARLREAEAELCLLELKCSSALRASGTAEVRAAFEEGLARARREHAEAQRALERAAPRRAVLSGEARPPTLASVRASLPEGVALIEYVFGREVRAAWVVRREAARWIELPASSDEVLEWIARLRRPVDRLRAGRTDVANLGFDSAAAEALYAGLVAPLSAALEDCRRVWIVPDGALWRAPFGAFVASREPSPADPSQLYARFRSYHFWIEDAALGLLPCAGLLTEEARAGEEPERGPLLLADPSPLPRGERSLSAARAELDSVRRALKARAPRVLLGESATEAAFKRGAARCNWIHLAAHGEANDEQPAYSRLVLAESPGQDGYLHAFEIEELGLAPGLVVLSACETARTARGGEGVLGLPRAFLIAGSGSVLASTWVVDDLASAELMRRYYLAIERGAAGIDALREAQLGTLREGERSGLCYAHPFFWAGYVHVGSP